MTIECHPIIDRKEWLTWRERDIVTASVCGALLTEHPFTTSMRLWAQARGVEFPPIVETKRMQRGSDLEELFPKLIKRIRPEWTLEPVNAYYRDPNRRLGATPDFWVLGDSRGRGVLQGKTAEPRVIATQWDEGRVAPEWIEWQNRCEILLTDAAFGVIAVLDPIFWECYILEVERTATRELALIAAVEQFWDQVNRGIEPPPDFERDAAVIRALTAHETPGRIRDLSSYNELPELLISRAKLKQNIEECEAHCKIIENEIKYLLGDAEQAIGVTGWRINYRTEHRPEYTVKARSGRVLRIQDKRGANQK